MASKSHLEALSTVTQVVKIRLQTAIAASSMHFITKSLIPRWPNASDSSAMTVVISVHLCNLSPAKPTTLYRLPTSMQSVPAAKDSLSVLIDESKSIYLDVLCCILILLQLRIPRRPLLNETSIREFAFSLLRLSWPSRIPLPSCSWRTKLNCFSSCIRDPSAISFFLLFKRCLPGL
jgi:hypothetical protein